jgi:hypothetical protein
MEALNLKAHHKGRESYVMFWFDSRSLSQAHIHNHTNYYIHFPIDAPRHAII